MAPAAPLPVECKRVEWVCGVLGSDGGGSDITEGDGGGAEEALVSQDGADSGEVSSVCTLGHEVIILQVCDFLCSLADQKVQHNSPMQGKNTRCDISRGIGLQEK